MMLSFRQAVLGRTGMEVGRLGISSTYGMPAAAVEMAFEHGSNYLYWGSVRRSAFGQALRNLAPRRDRFALVVQSYWRIPRLVSWSLERALCSVRYDYADVLLLGMWNGPVRPSVLEAARELKRRGLVRYLAASTHRRTMVPGWATDPDLDVIHFRYSAAHPGAERDIFPHLPEAGRGGLVSFTATSWGQLLKSGRMPKDERVPTAADCYRFVLSRPEVDVCMTGAPGLDQTKAALAAIEAGPMSQSEIEWMKRVGAAVYGGRPKPVSA